MHIGKLFLMSKYHAGWTWMVFQALAVSDANKMADEKLIGPHVALELLDTGK